MKRDWSGQTGGTQAMQRALVSLFRYVDIRVAYVCMHLWLIWYMLVRPAAVKASYRYHRLRGRGRFKAAADVYRSFYHFGKAIIDRFAVYAGVRFEVNVENSELYYGKMRQKQGLVLLFSHLGNSEMAAYACSTPDKRMNIIAFGGESQVVMTQREKVLAANNIGLIRVVPDELGHIYEISKAVSQGEVITMAGDRNMGGKSIICNLLGKPAQLPLGPFQLCSALKCPVLLTFVVKTAYRSYTVYTEQLDNDASLPREKAVQNLANQYVQHIQQMIRKHPYQWFNFYDFWADKQ